jgi:hypothetical protein
MPLVPLMKVEEQVTLRRSRYAGKDRRVVQRPNHDGSLALPVARVAAAEPRSEAPPNCNPRSPRRVDIRANYRKKISQMFDDATLSAAGFGAWLGYPQLTYDAG